ncbi:winged helix-turn-helix transcriptional regulator [Tunturiibacter lichenicola]|jgi:DNA-binding HxlR family transcriptional regulator|uniref:winged helix-turn-helix transcriptional regulator n=1 Tax=Acidobacteriaceae TaxID=204434 RepID=UPI001008A5B1
MQDYHECASYIQRVSGVKTVLQGKWSLEILCAMRTEPVRLSRLMRLIPKASKKALRANLRSLESARIVVRRDLSDTLLHVEYDFVDDTRETIWTILDHLAVWGKILQARAKVPPSQA